MKTVHVVAVESDSSGLVNWYYKEADAIRFFTESGASIDWAANDINRFAFDVPDSAHPDDITAEADNRMHEMDYTPIERRTATKGDDIFLPA